MLSDGAPLARQVFVDRTSQARMCNVVHAVRWGGHVAPEQLVRALGTSFDLPEVAGDRKVDGLIVARLEVQERVILDGAPIPAEENAAAEEVQRPCDILAAPSCHY